MQSKMLVYDHAKILEFGNVNLSGHPPRMLECPLKQYLLDHRLNLRCPWCWYSRYVGSRDCWLWYNNADGVHFLSIEWSVNFSWRVHPFLCSTFLVIVHQISEKLMPFLPDENFCIHLLCCFARVSVSSFIVWSFPCSLKLIGDKRFKKRLQKFVCVTGVWILSWALSKYLEWLQGLLLYAYTLMSHCFKLHKTWCFPHPLHFCLTAY